MPLRLRTLGIGCKVWRPWVVLQSIFVLSMLKSLKTFTQSVAINTCQIMVLFYRAHVCDCVHAHTHLYSTNICQNNM